jgi:Mg-chelatase subunit ChlD
MLAERFNAIAARLERLRRGDVPALSTWQWLRTVLSPAPSDSLERIFALGADLERVGIHTTADAKLLQRLAQSKGRAQALSQRLWARATEGLAAMEVAVSKAEREARDTAPTASSLRPLSSALTVLARAIKVAAVFGESNASTFELLPSKERAFGAPVNAHVAVAEYFAERARGQVVDTTRKAQDLHVAHELLLRMGADAKEDRTRVRRLRIDVAAARERLKTAPMVRSLDALARHLRHTARRDPKTAWRSLRALYDRAVEGNDAALAHVASGALEALDPNATQRLTLAERDEVKRALQWNPEALAESDSTLPPGGRGGAEPVADALTQLAFSLSEDQAQALALAAGCARYFDIEGALSQELVDAEVRASRPVQRKVPYPTQVMAFDFANTLEQVHQFVIARPSSVVIDLAAGRQLVRQYLDEEPPPKPKKVTKTAVRVYVLDASGSMHGARARFRDAILIAELNAIRLKARQGIPFDPLYFCFFNDAPAELTRIDSGEQATAQIEKLFRQSPADGQTDITFALVSAFRSIQEAQHQDPYLARATVVLVTDGEDGVDREVIRKARRPFDGLDISLSFISLGGENVDLKSLVLEQRSQGRRAFYHHLSDQELKWVRTEFDSAWHTLLPAEVDPGPEALERLLPHLEALEALAQRAKVKPPEQVSAQFDALFPAQGSEVERSEKTARMADVVEAVAEAASLVSIEARSTEAVGLLIHLLGVYEVPVAEYLAHVPSRDERLVVALKRVRLLCRPFS